MSGENPCTRLFEDTHFFAFCTPKIPSVTKMKKMRLNVCVNEMAPLGPFAAFTKGYVTFDSGVTKGGLVCARDETANPPGMKVFWRDVGFLKISCLFALCVVCSRRRTYLLRIARSSEARCRGRQGERPCVSGLRRSELSAQR